MAALMTWPGESPLYLDLRIRWLADGIALAATSLITGCAGSKLGLDGL